MIDGPTKIPYAPADLARALIDAERTGYHGLRVENGHIIAWKGKAGPCYDTGRTARYTGSAAAAMDDDRHLLYGTLRVCEKTARIYAAAAYAGWTEVSAPDAALMARLETSPAPFDCDTFQADAAALASTLTEAGASGERTGVFYPGPFKLLILRDGTMVPRGRWVRLPGVSARELEQKDGATLDAGRLAEEPANYIALFKSKGAACLLDETVASPNESRPALLMALNEASDSMRRRLQAMIERGDPYFILTGSDPSLKDGCCPSNEVGEANRLARAGILDALGASPNSDCPVTIYAFAGEIKKGDAPDFERNEPLRAAVRDRIQKGRELSPRILLRIALVIVGLLSLLALGFGIYRQVKGGDR
jgi:hypothetical protein